VDGYLQEPGGNGIEGGFLGKISVQLSRLHGMYEGCGIDYRFMPRLKSGDYYE
jgi:hypothetical protein